MDGEEEEAPDYSSDAQEPSPVCATDDWHDRPLLPTKLPRHLQRKLGEALDDLIRRILKEEPDEVGDLVEGLLTRPARDVIRELKATLKELEEDRISGFAREAAGCIEAILAGAPLPPAAAEGAARGVAAPATGAAAGRPGSAGSGRGSEGGAASSGLDRNSRGSLGFRAARAPGPAIAGGSAADAEGIPPPPALPQRVPQQPPFPPPLSPLGTPRQPWREVPPRQPCREVPPPWHEGGGEARSRSRPLRAAQPQPAVAQRSRPLRSPREPPRRGDRRREYEGEEELSRAMRSVLRSRDLDDGGWLSCLEVQRRLNVAAELRDIRRVASESHDRRTGNHFEQRADEDLVRSTDAGEITFGRINVVVTRILRYVLHHKFVSMEELETCTRAELPCSRERLEEFFREAPDKGENRFPMQERDGLLYVKALPKGTVRRGAGA